MSKRCLFVSLAGILFLLTIPAVVFAQRPITLTFTHMNPQTAYSSVHCVEPWAKAVEEATNGRVKIQIYYGQTLSRGPDIWNSVKLGIADMGWNFHGFWPGMTPLADVVSLPGLPFESAEKGSAVFWQLYEKYPQMQKEFDDVKVLNLFTSEPYWLITRNKPVTSIEDLRGMKIRTTGGPPTDQMRALGGTPVSIPMPDVYMSMQKGVVDGMGASWEPIYGYRLYEVANHYTRTPFPAVYFSITMNKRKWESLPKDIQEAIMSVSGLEGSKFWGKHFWDIAHEATMKRAKENGKEIKVTELSEAEWNRWVEIGGTPIQENWVKDMERRGHPEAREILQTLLELSAK